MGPHPGPRQRRPAGRGCRPLPRAGRLSLHRVVGYRRRSRASPPRPPAEPAHACGTWCARPSVYGVSLLGAANDLIATRFIVSVNAVTWAVRIGLFAVPLVVFAVTKRWALALQWRDREKVLHG